MTESAYRVSDLQERGWLLVEDGNHGEYRPRSNEFGTGDYRFIRAADMDGGRVMFERAERINSAARSRIRKGVGASGDVLFSHKGTVGKVALVPNDAPPFVCSPQTTFWRTLDENQIDRRYLYYFLCSPEFTEQWEARKDETDMAAYVSLSAQRELFVRLPHLRTQRAISGVLGVLDNKIELNRQMNRTLEELASALFKSWFVDFDPVQARRDGRRPVGVPGAVVSLFPKHFEESELGQIPRAWQVVPFESLAEIKGGKQLPTEECLQKGPFPVFGGNGLMGFAAGYTHRDFVIAFGRVGANCGSVLWNYGHAWINNNASAVVPKANREFVLQAMLETDFEPMRTGSAQPFIPNSALAELSVLDPGSALRASFCEIAEPLRQRQATADRQSATLATLRDTLLPALFSGEVTIRESETAVAEVA